MVNGKRQGIHLHLHESDKFGTGTQRHRDTAAQGHWMLEGTGARAEILHGDTGERGYGMLEATEARDEIRDGDTGAWGHGMLEGTGARDEIWHGDTGARGHGMARRARNLSDSICIRFTTSLMALVFWQTQFCKTMQDMLLYYLLFIWCLLFNSVQISKCISSTKRLKDSSVLRYHDDHIQNGLELSYCVGLIQHAEGQWPKFRPRSKFNKTCIASYQNGLRTFQLRRDESVLQMSGDI